MGDGVDEGQAEVERGEGLVFVCVDEVEQVVGGFVVEGFKVGLVDDFFFGEASSYGGRVGACVASSGVCVLGIGACVCNNNRAGVGGGGRERGTSWVEERRRRPRRRVEESGG